MRPEKTVLLVEDHEDSRAIYRIILEYGGYRVIEAHDGEQGVRMARDDAPDLILMDVSLPRLDGWEATRILKADDSTAQIPIIALTAHNLASDRTRATEVGCDGYLAGPAEPHQEQAEVSRLLSPAVEDR